MLLAKIHRLGVLFVDSRVSASKLDGPVSRTVLSKDLVVLNAGLDGPGIQVGWSLKDQFPMGNLICLCEVIFIM